MMLYFSIIGVCYKISELLVAIQRYLSQGPCQEAAQTLKNEIEKNQVFVSLSSQKRCS